MDDDTRFVVLSQPHTNLSFQLSGAVGIVFYAVFFYDFGDHEHVFQAPRRWAARKKAEFMTLSPEEKTIIGDESTEETKLHGLHITYIGTTDNTATSISTAPDPSPSVENKPDVFPNPFHSPITNYSDPSNLFAMPDLSTEVDHKPHDVLVYPFHSPAVANDLIATARALVYPRGKGIYATDETPDLIAAVLHAAAGETGKPKVGTDEGEKEKRRQWREAAYNAISGDYISGVILYSETLLSFQLGPLLTSKGIIPGVRANGELRPLPNYHHEFIVEGLDGLFQQLQAARIAGARFSKWRVPIACTSVERGLPSEAALDAHAETLAQYASVSQQAGLVPIVEPDVEFMEDADLARSAWVHEQAIARIYERCRIHGVLLEGSLIKPSFPQPGMKHPSRESVTPEEIALATATTISRSVPSAVPGVVFLSGGLPASVATSYLGAVNKLVNEAGPESPLARLQPLTFSFGRALQGDAAKSWVKGDEEGMKEAFEMWSRACWLAAQGKTA
ncbi:hypothetical protein C0989_009476 [Termitomyces sp. Mn162]|nr:hypothetical protein C0989_009476 [Termitomyces sp. Mn162]